VERRRGDNKTKIIFITAITHAAIEACRSKLSRLMDSYRSIDSLPTQWLRDVKIEVVTKGTGHSPPQREGSSIQIYVGTIYQVSSNFLVKKLVSHHQLQLYNFTKTNSMEVDCVVIDEAGQISLGAVSLVVRSLSPNGRIVIAGDSEQLAPILSGQYPQLKSIALFGSVLDCLMFSRPEQSLRGGDQPMPPLPSPADDEEIPPIHDTVVQLTENFRYVNLI
jgi:AAA domain